CASVRSPAYTLVPYTTLFRSDEANDGASALAKLRARRFGLVISDWAMEPMSGLELLQQMRADPDLAPLPFIMITAENRKERIAKDRKSTRLNSSHVKISYAVF